MSVINRLDHRGHGPVAEWQRGQGEDIAARVFAEHQAKDYTMFDISRSDGVMLKRFDPDATEILAVPRMQAG